ncbi:MAG: DUF2752 domain-containing protein [Synechococcus sp. YX04-3]|nr:MAG: DUF2752 domain-containing protein [Synechococcus sp. YX04-3]
MLPSVLTGSLWLKGLHPELPGWACPLRALTGVPCPTCFLTRATAAALSGDLHGSIQWHAFGPMAAAGLLIWSGLALHRRRLFPLPGGEPLWLTATLALMAFWLLRLILNYGFEVKGILGFPALP